MLALGRYARVVLVYNIAVIGWGAYVRATGSGAGCGNHWPLCNGEVIPRTPAVATLIELSHRLTSGLALLTVLGLLIWTFRACERGHLARRGAVLSMFFIMTEAAVGAGLVLFELVADNATMARAMFMAVHLVNTFFLLGALTVTGWALSSPAGLRLQSHGRTIAAAAAGCVTLLLAGASGAVAALGDTLFPAPSLADAISGDFSTTSHLLLRLRVLHPLLALVAAATVVLVVARLSRGAPPSVLRIARTVRGLVAFQVALGFANVVLLAPVPLQLVHLLLADLIWVGFVVVAAEALAELAPREATGRAFQQPASI